MQAHHISGLVLLFAFTAQAQAQGNVVQCESEHDKRVSCEMNTGGVVKIKQQLSKTRCVEDENWGITKHTVWVDKGCRAVFELEGSDSTSGKGMAGDEDPQYASNKGAPTAAVRACNAVQDWYGEVLTSTAMKPGWWEIILQYDSGKYVCNVSESGEIESFERLNNQ